MRAAVRVQRRRLAADRRQVARLGPRRVVGVAQLFDLPLAQPADRAGQQPGDLGAQRRGDLRGPRQQEVAGQDGLQVAPLGVDRLDAAAGRRLVHHVVVVQRAGLHQLAGDAACDERSSRRIGGTADLRGHHGQHRAQPLAAGDDEVRGDLGEVRVGGVDRLDQGRSRCAARRRSSRQGRRSGDGATQARLGHAASAHRTNVPRGSARPARHAPRHVAVRDTPIHFDHVRTLHRSGPAGRGARPGGSAAAEPQLHRHRAHPARSDPRG